MVNYVTMDAQKELTRLKFSLTRMENQFWREKKSPNKTVGNSNATQYYQNQEKKEHKGKPYPFSTQCVPAYKYQHGYKIPTCAIFYPAKLTWLQEIAKGVFATWPFLTYNAVNKYLNPSTIKSHGKRPAKIHQTQSV